jgi:putative nucleotidyltransferase with HDIG domain
VRLVPAKSAKLPRFITLVIAAGFGVIAHSIYSLPGVPNPAGWIVLGVLAIVAASFALKVPGVPVYLSISDAFFITSALLFGAAPATLTIAVDSLVVSLRRRNDFRQLLFNTTSNAFALWCGVQTYYALSQHGPMARSTAVPDETTIIPLACLAAVYFALNSGLTAVAVALSKGAPVWMLWRQHFAIFSLNYFAAASASFFLIVLVRHVGVAAITVVTPLILVCYLAMKSWLGRLDDADHHVAKVNRLYLSTVSALSTAIEAKDGVTSDHIHRVQTYAMGLARALDLTDPPTLQAIEAAALLHDTGKLAIPEHILNKPGKLTASEFDTMKAHVDVGADILSSIDFPYPVVPIVRAHHENWNGTGYPNGLRGEEIPIGARILSVVDCYDALTSDRPYRPAMTDEQAFKIIIERRGIMYDPKVVDTFMRVCRDIAPVAKPQPQLRKALGRISRAHLRPNVAESIQSPVVPMVDASDELLAFGSLGRVIAGTPTISDIGSLVWAHIRHLGPETSFALFVVDGGRNSVVAQYAAGTARASLMGLTMGLGHRLSGWVAANARSVTNFDARLDFTDQAAPDVCYALAVPLVANAEVVGVVTLYAPEPFAEDRSRIFEMIAPHIASAVASAQSMCTKPALAAADHNGTRSTRPQLRVVARR